MRLFTNLTPYLKQILNSNFQILNKFKMQNSKVSWFFRFWSLVLCACLGVSCFEFGISSGAKPLQSSPHKVKSLVRDNAS